MANATSQSLCLIVLQWAGLLQRCEEQLCKSYLCSCQSNEGEYNDSLLLQEGSLVRLHALTL